MRYKHEATRHVLINAFLAPVRVMSLTTGSSTYIAHVNDRAELLELIVDDGTEPGASFAIEFRSIPRPQFDGLDTEFGPPDRSLKSAGRPTLVPAGPAARRKTIRVARVEHDGSTYVVPAEDFETAMHEVTDEDGDGDGNTVAYKITFGSMPRHQFDALGEFDGF